MSIETSVENAPKLAEWIAKRGGICVWKSIDLSDPGAECFTPGDRPDKPHWKYADMPEEIVTDSSNIILNDYKEVRRFHVAVRMGASGLRIKCTDASSRKIRAACNKAGENSIYRFDYETQEAVILVPAKSITLNQWMEENREKKIVA